MIFALNQEEVETLLRQDPATEQEGGFQSFMVSLQTKIDVDTGELDLSADDLEKIPRYAFQYGNGGWEGRLKRIFGRVLGPRLGG